MWFTLQVALASPMPVRAPVAPPAPASGVACPANTWVSAGTLTVRAGPSSSAEVVGELVYGDAARRTRCDGDLARVEADGLAGWVTRSALSLDPVGVKTVRAELFREGDARARRVWAARYAALRPSVADARAVHRDLLQGGHFAAADDLAEAMGWPVIELVRAAEGRIAVYREELPWRSEPAVGPLPAAAREAIGVAPDEIWWVLGAEGAPVRATVGAVRVVDELELHVVAELVPDKPVEDPLVAARGAAPPDHWLVDDGAEVRVPVGRAVTAAVAASGRDAASTRTWASGEARGVRVFHDAGRLVSALGEPGMVPTLDFVDLRVDPDGAVHAVREGWDEAYAAELPRLVRDLDGDGRPDTVWQSCTDRVEGADGTLLAVAPTTCGC